mmetsp:Transcript_8404/g.20807  ORF Transcript_8404/g.20807 Transcript_8404/m.20807 type:complete len:560 (-) Transcript_8404:130-1809(-)
MVWECTQRFYEGETRCQEDIVSALQFNRSGELLAAADNGGRVVIYEQVKQEESSRAETEDSESSEGAHAPAGMADEPPSVSGRAINPDANNNGGASTPSLKVNRAANPNSGEGARGKGQVYYKHLLEFQSHEREFDYLKSMEIEERVNQVKWFHSASSAINLITTNDKRIKLWSVKNRRARNISNFNFRPNMNVRPPTTSEALSASMEKKAIRSSKGYRSNAMDVATIVNSQLSGGGRLKRPYNALRVPCISNVNYVMSAVCRRNYANGHLYHIHSVDINTDGETFISADDLHINLWNFEVMHESFNIVDMQPGNMDELTEVITSALFHPSHCNIMAYSSSKGTIRLSDLRQSALCDRNSKVFEIQRASGESHSFFTEIVANVTDVKFTPNGNELIARDYLSVKRWDLRKESEPVCVYNVQDALMPKLVDLYENDCIFDKFECCMSHTGEHIASGSYSNTFRIFGTDNGSDELLEASMTPTNVFGAIEPSKTRSPRFAALFGKGGPELNKRKELDLNLLNCNAKVRHMQWHPTQSLLAVSKGNEIYMLADNPHQERRAP